VSNNNFLPAGLTALSTDEKFSAGNFFWAGDFFLDKKERNVYESLSLRPCSKKFHPYRQEKIHQRRNRGPGNTPVRNDRFFKEGKQ